MQGGGASLLGVWGQSPQLVYDLRPVKLPDSFLEELRARASLASLVGRKARLVRSGRNWKACCPFHGEKSPSFYVYDDHFHCFGCGAHGDAIGFVMQAQGVSFMEAVEALAAEAGLDVPKPSAREAAAEQAKLELREIVAETAGIFQEWLWAPGGAAALTYLRGRGLSDDTIQRFGLGWSGSGRGAVRRRFAGRASPEALLAAGLLRPGEDGAPGDELFFERVMFPIRDGRGRVIAFGGRTLADRQPKYVNSPETPLFAKRRTLYGLDLARGAARGGAPVVAVEGYMDVIALHQAGFAGAVAPLGTALGAEQIEALWGQVPAPVLCFDGDAAGARAAARAVEVALPLVTAERTLRFASLPAGEDPDTLVRAQGAGAFRAVLEAAQPFSAVLFEAKRGMAGDRTPEQRARLRALLDASLASLRDPALRREYRRDFEGRLFAAGRARPRPRQGLAPPRTPPAAEAAARHRGEILLALILAHPVLLDAVGEALAGLALPERLAGLRDATFAWAERAERLDSASLNDHLANLGMTSETVRLRAVLPAQATAERAQAFWWHFYGLSNADVLERQVAAARTACVAAPSQAAFDRLAALSAELGRVRRGEGTGESLDD